MHLFSAYNRKGLTQTKHKDLVTSATMSSQTILSLHIITLMTSSNIARVP